MLSNVEELKRIEQVLAAACQVATEAMADRGTATAARVCLMKISRRLFSARFRVSELRLVCSRDQCESTDVAPPSRRPNRRTRR